MEKTIRMPKELLDKWLAALRSGEYKQCAMSMAIDDGYCCLGVLVVVGGGNPFEHAGTPNPDWLEHNGVNFADGPNNTLCNPFLPALGTNAAEANDSGASFAEIADAIEACAEGI